MKRAFLLLIVVAFTLTSCATTDAFGNKQTRKQAKAVREMGCPGHSGYVGY